MGMSASQARYLGLTARKNNNEFEAQQVAEQKTMLAMQMDMVATDYTKKVSNRELLFVQMDPTSNKSIEKKLSYDIITSTNPFSGLNMRVVDANGKVIVPNDQTAYLDQMQQSAIDAYAKAKNNKCYTQTIVNPNNTTSERIFNGQNFASTYLSGLGTSNSLIDKDGKEMTVDEFKEKTKLLNAPDFFDFWSSNGYSIKDSSTTPSTVNNPLNQNRNYIEDDEAAKATYETETARIDGLRSIQYKTDLNCMDSDYLENKLRSGEWFLEKHNPNVGESEDWISTSWQGESSIEDVNDKSDDGTAEAEYTQQSDFFKSQDRVLELRMKQLDTEHSTIQTEMDSVKKVIDKNIEGSFKTFA